MLSLLNFDAIASLSSKVPGVNVYRVLSASIPFLPASLILSGVGKSNSPTPRLITSTPSAFNFFTCVETCIVADVTILFILSANIKIPSGY